MSDVKFDENLFKDALAILKFDEDNKSLDKLEFTTLLYNLAKMLASRRAPSNYSQSAISSAKLHRLANNSAQKNQTNSFKLVSENLKLKATT